MDNIATETAHPADDGESPEVTAPLLEQGPQDAPGGPGSLFMVATPIGNVLDMSPRARQVLESADLVLAEGTRRSLQLCRELGVRVRRITSFHDHNEQEKEPEMLERLARGENLALISDAGTPVIADPGYRLARAAREKGFSVHPVPGPSAPVTALSAAGIPPLPYTFLGFMPRDRAGRKKLFSAFAPVPGTLVFFERKDRLNDTLETAASLLGARECAVCRELTKTHEEFILFHLEDRSEWPQSLLGELTVLIGPPREEIRTGEEEVSRILAEESASGGKPKAVARRVQARVTGWSASDIYALAQKSRD